jgi:ketosteroid isomerase-like protein
MSTRVDRSRFPNTAAGAAAFAYLAAVDTNDFSKAAEFFSDDLTFDGLILQAKGRGQTVEGLSGAIKAAHFAVGTVVAVSERRDGANSRVLLLYHFSAGGGAPAPICDQLFVTGGRITRLENVFDARPFMPQG